MTCLNCGKFAPADSETGYHADDLCPTCQQLLDDEPTMRCHACGEDFDPTDPDAVVLHVSTACIDDDVTIADVAAHRQAVL